MKIPTHVKNPVARLATLLAALAAPAAFAASQTWTNTPVSGEWATPANWGGNATPGQVGFTTGAQNSDVITFNTPLFGGIGGGADPFRNSDTNRQVRHIVFDGATCGSYLLVSSNGFSIGLSTTLSTEPGSVTITPTVVNPQVVDNLTLRLQNSQNAAVGFTNNSTMPAATLTINNITNGSANSRPQFITLAGANTGLNSIGHIDNFNGAGGAIHIWKYGAGTWVFTGPNDLPQKTSGGGGGAAHIQIDEGTLIVKDAASLGFITSGNLYVTNTGVLQIDGVTLQNNGVGLRKGGTIRMNGVGTLNGLLVGNHAATVGTLTTVAASDVLTVGGSSVVSGGAADSIVQVTGPGTVQLASPNTYVGNWSLAAKTNQLITTPFSGARDVRLAAGSILDVAPVSFYSLESASFTADGSGTVVGGNAATITAGASGTFDFGTKAINLTFAPTAFAGDTTHPVIYVSEGVISLGGNQFNVNNTSGTPLGAGTYRLIQQASGVVTAAGGSFAIVSGAGLASGHIGEIQVSGGNVNLVVSPHVAANLLWQGGNPNSTWDNATTANWFDGVGLVNFLTSDTVTFNATGIANPLVSLATTLLPGNVRVDTTAGNYTFSGAGQIAGPAALVKVGANSLILQTPNTYLGGTTVSNGTIQVGIDNAISASGSGNVSVYSPGVIDLNNFSNNVNGLIGDGTIDNLAGGAATILVGNNGANSTFTGSFKNTAGTLGVTKTGAGTLTIGAAQTYSGPTIVSAGTLRVNHYHGLGSGQGNVVVNGGILNITTNVVIGGLLGAGGAINNNSATAPSTITIQGNGEYTGVIGNGPVGAGISLFIKSGTTRLNAANTYSNGTVVASGAAFAIGVINPGGSGNAGTGGIIASNNTLISLPSAVSTAAIPGNNITNIEATGTVTLSSASQGNGFNGQFIGGPNATNIFVGPGSLGGATSFANFAGTLVFSNGSSWRWFNANGGGDNAMFVIEAGANIFSRDANTIRLGALTGAGGIGNPSVAGPATYLIGGKNLSTTFSGSIAGSNNITKIGAGLLTLDGVRSYTNTVMLPDTTTVDYTLFTNAITHLFATTVSNGTLRVVAPNNLTNSPTIALAGGTLDVSAIGYWTNQTTLDINSVEQPTNSVAVVTATLDILAGQNLNGSGNITGSVNAQAGSTVNVGLGIGTLNVSGAVALNGTVNMELNRTNIAQNSDRLTAASFSGSGATLNITNVGPTLISGTVFQLFNQPVAAFSTVNLPATDASGLIAYTWQNNLAVNGSITLVTGLNPNPAPITSTVNGNVLQLSWPLDHTGWTLLAQTNSLAVGVTGNWFPVAGSTTTNQMFVPIVVGNPTVFYRLRLILP